MELIEAIRARHSVRKYTDRAIEAAKVAALRAAVERVNGEAGLNIQLVLDEPKAFSTGMWKYGMFSGVRNYFVMAGPKGKEAEEKIGYHGEQLVLLAQTLGLNTCWVGLSYSKVPGTYELAEAEKIGCYISLGYGLTQGKSHKSKTAKEVSNASDLTPEWFNRGIDAALLAPTAVNQQKFYIEYLGLGDQGGLPRVAAKPLFSMIGYTQIDLGIVKYHFEVGAGKERFEWALQK